MKPVLPRWPRTRSDRDGRPSHIHDREQPEGTTVFDVHGFNVGLGTSPNAIYDALERRLRAFRTTNRSAHFTFETITGAPPHVSADDHRVVYESVLGRVEYHPRTGTLTGQMENVGLVFELPDRATAVVQAGPLEKQTTWLVSEVLFTLALIEAAKCRGIYAVQAAAVAVAERAILLFGRKGTGKSTLAMTCAAGGYDLLSDNLVLVRQRRDGCRVHGLSEPINFGVQPVEAFHVVTHERAPGRRDGLSPVAAVDVTKAAARLAVPHALVFLGRADLYRPVLTPISSTEALLALTPNIMLTDPATSQGHLHALGELCGQVPCYRLDSTPNPDSALTLLNPLVGALDG